jgi:RimJ/RimL family protein N-acetyltransferase
MTIRPAAVNDARAIAEVHIAAWRAAYSEYMPRPFLEALDIDERTRMWERALEEPGPGTILIIEREGLVAGFCVYGPSRDTDAQPNTGELAAINLHPFYWRRGLGTEVCLHVLAEARKLKWSLLTLWVIKGNAPARALYERPGFVLDGGEKQDSRLIGSPLHEVRYRKTLQ